MSKGDQPPKVPKMPTTGWTIRLAEPAEAVYRELNQKAMEAEERNDATSAHCKTLRMVDEMLDRLIPQNPIDHKNALAGNLSNIFRYKKGRMRIYWIASSVRREVVVLFISDTPRKEGDAHDPYEMFSRMVMSGKYNEIFKKLGVRLPPGTAYETH